MNQSASGSNLECTFAQAKQFTNWSESLRRAYPALSERAVVGSIPANPNTRNVPSFSRWRFGMKLSLFTNWSNNKPSNTIQLLNFHENQITIEIMNFRRYHLFALAIPFIRTSNTIYLTITCVIISSSIYSTEKIVIITLSFNLFWLYVPSHNFASPGREATNTDAVNLPLFWSW